MFLRVIRRVIASRDHPYITSKKYTHTNVPKSWVKARSNIPEITKVTTAIQGCVTGTTVKETDP
jgi:hypothetical protein